MSSTPATLVSRALGRLPAPLLRLLDAWALRAAQKHREARRKAQELQAQRQRSGKPVS